MVKKGIILAGGRATRLYPVTKGVCKQILPVYDKPMVYYPLSVLMLAGIRDVLLISTPKDIDRFKDLLSDGSWLGINISYAVQEEPKGIAEGFIIAERFIGKDNICLILGDNIFYGHNFTEVLKDASALKEGAAILGYYVNNPSRYGVIELDNNHKAVSIEEKPKNPKSSWVVTGLYFYDNKVVNIARNLKPSLRQELEISDVNNVYLKEQKLNVILLGRGYAWLDTGTHDSLMEASLFIKTMEERQGLKIGCVEEVAYRMGYIGEDKLFKIAQSADCGYADYLKRIINEKKDFDCR